MTSLSSLCLVGSLLACYPMPAASSMQDPGPPPQYGYDQPPPFDDPGYLEQLVAPIALYPDSLLTHVFMAATYPVEVVEAARWCDRNPGLMGDELEYALLDYEWDPSVKALCGFPRVLQQMSENLDWTQDLGDAVLEYQQDLLAAVQRMRRIAFDAGTLESTPQQTVVSSGGYIAIQPYDPGFVYVPYYAPTVVFPGWHFPHWHYPHFFQPHPGWGALAFHAGVHWGHHLFGHPNWHDHGIDIDVDVHSKFVKKVSKSVTKVQIENYGPQRGGKARFQHDPVHRRGVNYKSAQVAEKFGGDAGSTRVSRDRARGRTSRDADAGSGRESGRGRDDVTRDRDPSDPGRRDDRTTERGDRTSPPTPKSGDPGRGSSRTPDVGAGRGTSRPEEPRSTREAPRDPPRSSSSGSSRSTGRSGSSGVYRGSKDPGRDRSASQRGANSRGKSSSTGRSAGSSGNRSGGRSSGGSGGGRSGGGRSGGGRP